LNIKKEILKLILIAIPIVGFIVFVLIGLNSRDTKLEKEPAYTYAIIVKTYVGAKARHYIKYEFKVKGQTFSGDQGYMEHKEFIQIGDTCEVEYALTNPEISRLLENEDETLIIRNKSIIRKLN